MENFYEKQKGKLIKSFVKETKLVYPFLLELMDKESAESVIENTINQYKLLIPQVPFIGGSKNLMSKDLLESVKLLVFYKTMKSYGFNPEITFKIIYQVSENRFKRYPQFILTLLGRIQFSLLFQRRLIKLSDKSKLRKYPEDFVFDFVQGDQKSFDWGIEFSECAILKFFKSQNCEEFMPFICPMDFITSKYFGLGLLRTMSLAEGFPKCDQYLKKGRETKVKFPSGISF